MLRTDKGTRRLSLTFPLIQRQVRVVHRLIVGLRLGLLLGISELGEERQVERLRGVRPLLRVQQQHLFQDAHRCVAHMHLPVSKTGFSAAKSWRAENRYVPFELALEKTDCKSFFGTFGRLLM